MLFIKDCTGKMLPKVLTVRTESKAKVYAVKREGDRISPVRINPFPRRAKTGPFVILRCLMPDDTVWRAIL